MNSATTRPSGSAYRRYFKLVSAGLLISLVLLLAFAGLTGRQLNREISQLEEQDATLTTQIANQRLLDREIQRRGASVFDALTASLPDDLSISDYFTWLEIQAVRSGVHLTYSFDDESPEFRAFIDATPPNAWPVSFDIFGPPSAVRAFHQLLESGRYHAAIVGLTLETIDPTVTLLRSQLYVYGRI